MYFFLRFCVPKGRFWRAKFFRQPLVTDKIFFVYDRFSTLFFFFWLLKTHHTHTHTSESQLFFRAKKGTYNVKKKIRYWKEIFRVYTNETTCQWLGFPQVSTHLLTPFQGSPMLIASVSIWRLDIFVSEKAVHLRGFLQSISTQI